MFIHATFPSGKKTIFNIHHIRRVDEGNDGNALILHSPTGQLAVKEKFATIVKRITTPMITVPVDTQTFKP